MEMKMMGELNISVLCVETVTLAGKMIQLTTSIFLFAFSNLNRYDETLIPVDFQRAGQIRDDDLLTHLVKPMSAGVTMTCLMDCCHSGTVLDLPYRFIADGDHVSGQLCTGSFVFCIGTKHVFVLFKVAMEENEGFNINDWIDVARTVMATAAAAHVAGEAADIVADCCTIL
jgi:hypothetical protein